jgi:hypothetical protein
LPRRKRRHNLARIGSGLRREAAKLLDFPVKFADNLPFFQQRVVNR